MKCKICGTENDSIVSFCKSCGQPLIEEAAAGEQHTEATNNGEVYSGTVEDGERQMTKEELFSTPEFSKAISTINGWTTFLIIMGVLNTILESVLGVIPIDGILILILGIVVRKTKSVGAAVVVLILGIISVIYGLFTTGRPAGFLFIVGGGFLCSATEKVQNACEYYKNTGIIKTL